MNWVRGVSGTSGLRGITLTFSKKKKGERGKKRQADFCKMLVQLDWPKERKTWRGGEERTGTFFCPKRKKHLKSSAKRPGMETSGLVRVKGL